MDAVVGRADDPLLVVGHKVHDLFARHVGDFVAQRGAEILGNDAGGAFANVRHGLFFAFGEVDAYGQAPFGALDGLAVFGGGFLGDGPLVFQAGRTHHITGYAQRNDAGAVLAGGEHAGGRLDGGDDQREGLLIGAQLQMGVVQLKPVALAGVRFRAVHQAFDDAQGFVHHFALAGRVDAEHIGIGRQSAGADAKHHAPSGQMVQQHHPVRYHVGMMVGEADHAGAEAEVAGALGGGGHENFRRGDSFPAGAVVFADPGFVKAQVVQPLQQFQIAFQGQGRVFAYSVERGHKNAEFHTLRGSHRSLLNWASGWRGNGFV